MGNTPAGSSGTRACAIRQDEAAIRSGDHLNLDFADFTSEVWCRIASWPLSGAATLPLALMCGQNWEILASNPTGSTLRLNATMRVQDASEAESTGTTGNLDIASVLSASGTAWHLLTVQGELSAGRLCVWWDGVVKGTITGLTSPIGRIYVKRKYLGLLANTSGADVFVDPSPTTAGVISFDNWRISRSARYTFNANFTPPAVQFTDTGSPAYAVYPMRETTVPHVILSTFGQFNGMRPRIDAFADRYAACWSAAWNQTPNPTT